METAVLSKAMHGHKGPPTLGTLQCVKTWEQ